MDHFYTNIQGWFDFEDLYHQIISDMPNSFKFAEIGVWKGRSLSYFVVEAINSRKSFEIYAVDTWQGSLEHKENTSFAYEPLLETDQGLYNNFIDNIRPIKPYINIIKKESIDASMSFKDNYFDTIFIDASHEYIDVLKDLLAWWPKIKKDNPKIYGHDYFWDGVKKAVHEFAEQYCLKVSLVSKNSWVICN
jgi:hypothetical protein